MKTIAANKGTTLSTSIDARDQSTRDRLSNLSGAAFDRAYMRGMVADHKTDIAEFEREANHGMDSDLKAFAAKTLPTRQEHLKLAESASGNVHQTEGK